MAAKLCSFIPLGLTVSTTCPRRMTVTESATASTSLSLWVIKIMETPRLVSWCITLNKSSASWGVSTAVGSSKTKILAWR